jgi:phosphoglycolate phosphatase
MNSVAKATMIDGAYETLNVLRAARVRIGVLTSCRKYAIEGLKETGLASLIDEIAARDDCEKPKPHPSHVYWLMKRMGVEPNTVIMVGDHPTDSVCAKNAHVEFVGVLTGSWGAEQTKQLGPTAISSVKELPTLLGLQHTKPCKTRSSERVNPEERKQV